MKAGSRLLTFAESTFAGLLFIAAAIVGTFPLIRNLSGAVLEPQDTLQVAWLMVWNTDHLVVTPSVLFSPGVMYPESYALAFIEHMRGLLIPFAPIYWLSRNPILSLNLSLLFGYAMSGFGLFTLLRSLLPRTWAALWASLLAGLLFECSPWRLLHFMHLEQLSASWLALLLLCLIRYLERRQWYWLMGFTVFTVIQTLVSYYFVLTCAVLITATMLFMLTSKRASLRTVVIAGGMVSVTLLAAHLPLALMYLKHPLGQLRGPGEQRFFSLLTGWDLISSQQSAWLRRWLRIPSFQEFNMERMLDAGLLAYVLAGIGLIAIHRSTPTYRLAAIACFGVIAASLALSLGPYITVHGHRISAPFSLLAHLPGFASFRAPARLWQAGLFAIAVLGGLAMWRVAAGLDARITALIGVLLCLVPVYLAFDPGRSVSRITLDTRVFQWIDASLPKDAVMLQVPLDVRAADGYSGPKEAVKMYTSIYHHRQQVNSFMADMPWRQRDRQHVLATFPSPDALRCLRDIGVTHILVNRDELKPELQAQLDNPAELQRLGLQELYRDEKHQVMAALEGAISPPAYLRFTGNWHGLDLEGSSWWFLSWGEGTFEIISAQDQVLSFAARVNIITAPDTLRVYSSNVLLGQGEFTRTGLSEIGPIAIPVKAGTTTIRIINMNPATHVGADPRLIAYGIGDVSLNGEKVGSCCLR